MRKSLVYGSPAIDNVEIEEVVAVMQSGWLGTGSRVARFEQTWPRRQEIWQRYNEAFADFPITLSTPVEAETRHAYHLYTILIDEQRCGISRDGFLDAMTANNIGVGVHYMSIPAHAYYQQALGWSPEDYPNAMCIGRQTVSLPLSAKLTGADVVDVIDAVKRILL